MDAFYNFDALEQILAQLKKRLDEEKDKESDWVECVNAYPEYTVEAEQIKSRTAIYLKMRFKINIIKLMNIE